MGTDLSRVRHDPLKNYAAVELKQGGLLLDADANEGTDILDRRLRALGADLIGRVTVAATTPDAFEIKNPLAGSLTIGVGRMYVDGLLAECHGGDPAVAGDRRFDTVLAESDFARPLPYDAQPYLPRPAALPTSGRHLVYLDVWNREVTHLEQPDLVEVAVGVEASSRIQTVWQVRVHETNAGSDATCASPDEEFRGWPNLIASPTGTLTTGTFAVDPPTDPCDLPPTGGYRGLENQLYRVEIHDPTAPGGGGATFKWSRENGSVGSRVGSIVSATELELESLGRDDVLSFKMHDWVEITDDFREFAGRPGDVRRVTFIDFARRRITLAPALTPDLLPSPQTFPDSSFPGNRNQRVRRLDQSGAIKRTDPSGTPVQVQDLNAATSTGLIAVPSATTTLILEHGVTVQFDPGARGFRTGDFWVFAARTADASVEKLDRAPPRGIHHHYARLAIWDAGAGTVTDCRPKRQAGCCTFVVRPGESIQAAIDALPAAGGCVCLKAGLHPINEPIIIARDNVTLHGESMGAIVRGYGVILVIGGWGDHNARNLRISSIVFQQVETGEEPIVALLRAQRVVMEDCRLEADGRWFGYGLAVLDSTDIKVSGCVFRRMTIGAWYWGGCRNVTISGCEFSLSADQSTGANVAIWAQTMAGPIDIEDNIVSSPLYGIIVDDDPVLKPVSAARGSRVCGNRITLTGIPLPQYRAFAIDVAAEAAIVSDNHIEHGGGNLAGIRLCGSGSSARGNVIKSVAVRPPSSMLSEPSIAILAGDQRDQRFLPLERLVIAGNIIEGLQYGIVLLGVARSRVSGNILGGSAAEDGISTHSATDCLLAENVLAAGYAHGFWVIGGARNTLRDNSIEGGGWGISVTGEEAPTVSNNRMRDIAQNGIVIWHAAERCNVIENRVIRCGSAANVAVGIGAMDINGELHVEGNEVRDLGVSRLVNGPKAGVAYGINGEDIREARIESNLVAYSDPPPRQPGREDRALRMRGRLGAPPTPGIRLEFGSAAQITNNKFIGPGASALVEIFQAGSPNTTFARFERVLFHGNHCVHFIGPYNMAKPYPGATVSLVGLHCSITGNHVKALPFKVPSYDLHNMPGPFIGNVSAQGHSMRITQMPNPESSFNTNA